MRETDSLRLVFDGAAIDDGNLELFFDRPVNGVTLYTHISNGSQCLVKVW
jgi:hypothetical protein